MRLLQRQCGCGGSCGSCGDRKKKELHRSALDGARSGRSAGLHARRLRRAGDPAQAPQGGWHSRGANERVRIDGHASLPIAHVEAEQHAIVHRGAYPGTSFGPLPSDIPGAPICSHIVAALAPPPPFTGDFGNVTDRITYGIGRYC